MKSTLLLCRGAALVLGALWLNTGLFAAEAAAPRPLSSDPAYQPPTLGPREPILHIEFPGSATGRGLLQGKAYVTVTVDAQGRAKDVLIIGYTEKAFGEALRDHALHLSYSPAKFHGVAVPGRMGLGYKFEQSGSPNLMDHVATTFGDHDKLAYSAVGEGKLDKPLEFVEMAVPRVPADYPVKDGQPVTATISFYVDEQGHVHAPNAEVADAPDLITSAWKAIQLCSFKPPTVEGKPALVLVERTIQFAPRKTTQSAANGTKP